MGWHQTVRRSGRSKNRCDGPSNLIIAGDNYKLAFRYTSKIGGCLHLLCQALWRIFAVEGGHCGEGEGILAPGAVSLHETAQHPIEKGDVGGGYMTTPRLVHL